MDASAVTASREADSLREKLAPVLEALARRLGADQGDRDAARQTEAVLRDMLAQHEGWGREAWTELQRLNALYVESQARAQAAEAELQVARGELARERARQTEWLSDDAAGLLRTLGTVQALSASGAPVFVRDDGKPAFRPRPGVQVERTAVVSAPKAGTYLIGEILKALGFQDSGVHGAAWGFSDLRWASHPAGLASLDSLNVRIDLADYIDLVRPGDYILTHLGPADAAPLEGFRLIAAIREVRAAAVSFMRYSLAHGLAPEARDLLNLPARERMARYLDTDHARGFFELTAPMADWIGRPDAIVVRYEDLTGPGGAREIARIADQVLAGRTIVLPDLQTLLATRTLTSSDGPSRARDWWSPEAESAFARLGGPAINARLGYPA